MKRNILVPSFYAIVRNVTKKKNENEQKKTIWFHSRSHHTWMKTIEMKTYISKYGAYGTRSLTNSLVRPRSFAHQHF